MPYVSTINRNASGNDIGRTAIITKDSVQPNVHADNLFVAKGQLSIDPSRGMAVDSIMCVCIYKECKLSYYLQDIRFSADIYHAPE